MLERIKAFLKGRKGVAGIGALILSLVVAMVTIFVALLLGGVLSSQISEQFTNFNVTGTWLDLFSQTQQIATSSIQIAVVGFLIAAFMVVLGLLGVFGKNRR